MNKTYKSIWSESLGTYVAASEAAVSGGRKVSSGRQSRRYPERVVSNSLALEQRIVFDAAVAATAAEVQFQVDTHAETLDVDVTPAYRAAEASNVVRMSAPLAQTGAGTQVGGAVAAVAPESAAGLDSSSVANGLPALAVTVDVSDAEADAANHVSDAAADAALQEPTAVDPALVPLESTAGRVEVIFVDAANADLVDHLQGGAAQVVLLSADRDGVEQIAEFLSSQRGVDAVHIISHGGAGRLALGSASLDSASLDRDYAEEMATIAAALSQNADLLLYGCNVAGTPEGVAFVDALAAATGADVAASTDSTGAADQGGDWILEQLAGRLETQGVAATSWGGLLDVLDVDQINPDPDINGRPQALGSLLSMIGKTLYSVDVETGKATVITVVPQTVGGIDTGTSQNSLAVDQVNNIIYYVAETQATTNTALFGYNFATGVHFVVDNDLTNNGVVVNAGKGLASGGAVFGRVNGTTPTLFLAVEGANTATDNARIYKLTFANSGTTVASATLFITVPQVNFGDLAWNPGTNELMTVSANGTNPPLVTRYNGSTGAQIGATVTAPASSTIGFSGRVGTQAGTDRDGNVYFVGGASGGEQVVVKYDPVNNVYLDIEDQLTGYIGEYVSITTDGVNPIPGGVVNDAAGWLPPLNNLGDQIFTDYDGDGTFDVGVDKGIAGVRVELYEDVNNDGVIDPADTSAGNTGNRLGDSYLGYTQTDANGNYQFINLLAGTYIVKINDKTGVLGAAPTYTTATPGGINASGDFVYTVATPIAQGRTISTADFGLVNRGPDAVNDTQAVQAQKATTHSRCWPTTPTPKTTPSPSATPRWPMPAKAA